MNKGKTNQPGNGGAATKRIKGPIKARNGNMTHGGAILKATSKGC